MILFIDTTKEQIGRELMIGMDPYGLNRDCEYVYAAEMNISHCLGCNCCWLKTPGTCVIRDDYEPLLKKISGAEVVWLISDTAFGFVSYRTKNIVDRVMPLVTMNLHFVKKQMRHVPRYEHNPDWGVIYTGEGDSELLKRWCERLALNFGSRSRGVYRAEEAKEALTCM